MLLLQHSLVDWVGRVRVTSEMKKMMVMTMTNNFCIKVIVLFSNKLMSWISINFQVIPKIYHWTQCLWFLFLDWDVDLSDLNLNMKLEIIYYAVASICEYRIKNNFRNVLLLFNKEKTMIKRNKNLNRMITFQIKKVWFFMCSTLITLKTIGLVL